MMKKFVITLDISMPWDDEPNIRNCYISYDDDIETERQARERWKAEQEFRHSEWLEGISFSPEFPKTGIDFIDSLDPEYRWEIVRDIEEDEKAEFYAAECDAALAEEKAIAEAFSDYQDELISYNELLYQADRYGWAL